MKHPNPFLNIIPSYVFFLWRSASSGLRPFAAFMHMHIYDPPWAKEKQQKGAFWRGVIHQGLASWAELVPISGDCSTL